MITSYTYKVTNVNKEAGAMELIFSALGYPEVTVGARMPYEGETVADIAKMFAPIAHWESLNKKHIDVEIGDMGEIIPVEVAPASKKLPEVGQIPVTTLEA